MEKLKIQFAIIVMCIINAYAQNKTIVPAKGEIVFKCKTTVLDQDLYNKSKKEFIKKFSESMKETLVIEQKIEGNVIDTVKINQIVNNIDATASFFEEIMFESENGFSFHHEYNDSILTQYKSKDNIKQDLLILNPKTRLIKNKETESNYNYSENNIIDIKEFKNEIKTIHNYNCFKVVYTFSEADFSEFSTLMSSYKITREMWVTDKIKAELHPIVKDREIMTRYYPLEIKEHSEITNGVTTEYELVSLKIQ